MVSVLCWFWNANNSFNDGSTMGGSKCFNIQLVYCFNKPKTFSSELFDFGLGFGVDLGLVQFLFSFCCLLSGLDLNWFCIDYGLVWFGMVCFLTFGPIFTKETHDPKRWSAAGAFNRRRGRFAPRAPRA